MNLFEFIYETFVMTYTLTIALISLSLLLGGCGTTRENKIKEEVLVDPHMPEEIRSAIDQRDLVVGMTKEQVIAAWGVPCKWCFGTRKSPSGDTWEYSAFAKEKDFPVTGSDILGLRSGIYLYFDRHGSLKHWSRK